MPTPTFSDPQDSSRNVLRRRRLSACATAAVVVAATLLGIQPAQGDDLVRAALSWGRNDKGQLGTGDTVTRDVPTVLQQLQRGVPVPAAAVTQVAAGDDHTLAIFDTGTEKGVLAWGSNQSGQLGIGKTSVPRETTPQLVDLSGLPEGTVVTQVAAGRGFSLGLTSQGQVLIWGMQGLGATAGGSDLGENIVRPRLFTDGLPADRISDIAAGLEGHRLALTDKGEVYSWGNNSCGQLGRVTDVGQSDGCDALPGVGGASFTAGLVLLPPGMRAVAIAAGGAHSAALTESAGALQTLLAWGANGFGQLGDGSTKGRFEPAPVHLPPDTQAATVAAGANHTLALPRDLAPGSANDAGFLAWGANNVGQLGTGTKSGPTPTPVRVRLNETQVSKMSTKGDHTLALTNGGLDILGWGKNLDGQLGRGTTTEGEATPAPTSSLGQGSRVSDVAAGGNHSLALAAVPASTTVAPTTTVPESTTTTVPETTTTTVGQDTTTTTVPETTTTTVGQDTTTTTVPQTTTTTTGGQDTTTTTVPQTTTTTGGQDTTTTTVGQDTTTTTVPETTTTTVGKATTTTTVPETTTTTVGQTTSARTTTTVDPDASNPVQDSGTTEGPTGQVSPSTVEPGQNVTVRGEGFPANDTLTMTLFSTPTPLGTTASDATGSYEATVRIPDDVAPGAHRLVIAAPQAQREASVQLTVMPSVPVDGSAQGAVGDGAPTRSNPDPPGSPEAGGARTSPAASRPDGAAGAASPSPRLGVLARTGTNIPFLLSLAALCLLMGMAARRSGKLRRANDLDHD